MLLRSSKRKNIAESDSTGGQVKAKRLKKETVPVPLKLTGLDDDCLEHVFGYLDATDLTNVAEAHTQFVFSARLVYKRKYTKKTVQIIDSGLGLSIDGETIEATATVFMGHFGDLLQSLSLDYFPSRLDPNDHHWRETEKAIFQNCSKTVAVIELKYFHVNLMEEIRQPFEMVNKLRVIAGCIDRNSIQLSKWFPNIRSLVFDSVYIRDPDGIRGEFQSLEYLRLKNVRSTIGNATETVAQNMLQSHRQIQHLSIGFNNEICSPDFLRFLSTNLPHLESLAMFKVYFSSAATRTNVHFQRLTHLEIDAATLDRLISKISISFGRLNKLRLYWIRTVDLKWRDFIAQNPTIEQLALYPAETYGEMSADNVSQIMSSLPDLNALEIRANVISSNVLIRLLEWWRLPTKLERFVLRVRDEKRLDEYLGAIEANPMQIYQKTVTEVNDITKLILSRMMD